MLENIIFYINVFFFVYMFIYAIVFFLTTLLATFDLDDFFERKNHQSSIKLDHDENYIPISILVPAYNEELTIVDAIESLLSLDYPEYEIIVINDGSTDKTLENVIKKYDLKENKRIIRKQVKCKPITNVYENNSKVRIVLIDKSNGGKSDALNAGINVSTYPLFVCMDADSLLQKDALKKIVEPYLENDSTIAVGGNIKVSNDTIIEEGKIVEYNLPKKLIAKFQLIEYLRVFLTSRVAFNRFNANLIISGAFGLYKKSAVIKVGGYEIGVIGEDMDLIVKLHAYFHKNKEKYDISYVPDAVCWTQVPEKFKSLKNQRRRWHRGMAQSLKENRYMFFDHSYGAVGMVSYPYFVLFEFISPFLEILGILTIIVSYIIGIINMKFFIGYLLFYMLFNLLVSFVSILLEKNMFKGNIDNKMTAKLFFYSILETFGYRQCCSLFRINAFFSPNKDNWGNMIRKENAKKA